MQSKTTCSHSLLHFMFRSLSVRALQIILAILHAVKNYVLTHIAALNIQVIISKGNAARYIIDPTQIDGDASADGQAGKPAGSTSRRWEWAVCIYMSACYLWACSSCVVVYANGQAGKPAGSTSRRWEWAVCIYMSACYLWSCSSCVVVYANGQAGKPAGSTSRRWEWAVCIYMSACYLWACSSCVVVYANGQAGKPAGSTSRRWKWAVCVYMIYFCNLPELLYPVPLQPMCFFLSNHPLTESLAARSYPVPLQSTRLSNPSLTHFRIARSTLFSGSDISTALASALQHARQRSHPWNEASLSSTVDRWELGCFNLHTYIEGCPSGNVTPLESKRRWAVQLTGGKYAV